MGELSKLPNIGKVLEKQLNDVGINTVDDLINFGSKEVWLKIKEIDDELKKLSYAPGGDVILREETEIDPNENAGELWDRLSKIGGKLLVETLDLIDSTNDS